ncbi:hypothetical protein BDV97DRAFT_98921 [Delphinella strobiligena]|nr:hypothetical protein BDV97DRAFT_98921 [Delphinella strobiligena]
MQRAQRIARNHRMTFICRCLGVSLRGRVIYIDPQQVGKHDIVFVAIDTEGGRKALPEVGVAFLDTRTISRVGPGDKASKWYRHIRARHFRLRHNGGHGFKFGVTERIPLAALKPYLKSCFDPRRRYVIVGHSVSGDLDKISSALHFDLRQDPCIVGQIDTREIVEDMSMPQKLPLLWRHFRGADSDPGTGLAFHNAGNDAVYNLQVLLMLALTPETEWQSPKPIIQSSELTTGPTTRQLDHYSTTKLSKNIILPSRESQPCNFEHRVLSSTATGGIMTQMAEVLSTVILSLAFAGTILSFTVERTSYNGDRNTSTSVKSQAAMVIYVASISQ